MTGRRRLNRAFSMLFIAFAFITFAFAFKFVIPSPLRFIDWLFQPQGKITDTFASYEQVEEINHSLNPLLTDILHNTDFFGYYRLNLYEAQCPVSWGDSFPMCGNRACAVDTLEEVYQPIKSFQKTNLPRRKSPKYGEHRF